MMIFVTTVIRKMNERLLCYSLVASAIRVSDSYLPLLNTSQEVLEHAAQAHST